MFKLLLKMSEIENQIILYYIVSGPKYEKMYGGTIFG